MIATKTARKKRPAESTGREADRATTKETKARADLTPIRPTVVVVPRDRRRSRAAFLAILTVALAAAAVLLVRRTAVPRGRPDGGPSDSAPDDATEDVPSRPSSSSSSSSSLYPPDPPRDTGRCHPARVDPSPVSHAHPVEGSAVSRVAFGSCFIPSKQSSDALWRHVRETFKPDLWVWLGDNMYMDTFDGMNGKRMSYNVAREDRFYSTFGPVAEPKIPVVATWDDHDFGYDNMGKEYPCLKSSQAEFVTHFNLPETDPRHPARGERQRNGVYGSHMFAKPGTDGGENGIHVILLDGRTHRSPTYDRLPSKKREARSYRFVCEGSNSTMLGDEQWDWLEREMLERPSVVKLIGSGVQVLPPTNRTRPREEYCSYDGPGGTFDRANEDLGEDSDEWEGTGYEGWAEMPAERAKLLRLAQKSINAGMARHVIFLTGDQHWAELQAKRMPPSDVHGPSRVLYSVTASGIDQNWIEEVRNANRLRVRSADANGDGAYVDECDFPFVVDGRVYDDCADVFGTGRPGCATRTDPDTNEAVPGRWGNCLPPQRELVPRDRMGYGSKNKCTDNYHHTCRAKANYGGIVVDWDGMVANVTIFTPHEAAEEAVASWVEIDL